MDPGTVRRLVKRAAGKLTRTVFGDPDGFLRRCSGVIHVGANVGQERKHYHQLGLAVVWIEPIPEVFDALSRNIAAYPDQIAIRALVADTDDRPCTLNVASNGGASSSMLELGAHRDIWPDIHYVDRLELRTVRLDTLIDRAGIDLARHDALVIDTQGTERLVLDGAGDRLGAFRYIKAEAADFELYAGCATGAELEALLGARGFRKIRSDRYATRRAGGTCFDLVFENRAAAG